LAEESARLGRACRLPIRFRASRKSGTVWSEWVSQNLAASVVPTLRHIEPAVTSRNSGHDSEQRAANVPGRGGPTPASTAPPSTRSRPGSSRNAPLCWRFPSSPSATTATAPTPSTSTAASRSTAYYPAPPGWIGRAVAVQWDGRQVRLLDPATGQLLREHGPQRPGGYAPLPVDQPSRTPPTTLALLARATRAGARIGALCDAIHRRDGAPADERVHALRLLGTRRAAGADHPHRLVGDHRVRKRPDTRRATGSATATTPQPTASA
jgi:hypothetical protein